MYLGGRPPKSVNMYWRRFKIADMPLDDHEKFDIWLRERWYEKDAFMEQYMTTGRFPASEEATNGVVEDEAVKAGFIETEVKLAHNWEVGNIFLILGAAGLLANLAARGWNVMRFGNPKGY